MEDKIRRYIDGLFQNTAPTRKAVELKEEMIQNLTEKYNDLLSEGKTPEAAYNIAIAGIGDISGLMKDLERDTINPEDQNAQRQKTAMLTAIAVMLYILSVVPLIVLGAVFQSGTAGVIGVVIMFLLIAGATGLLIYNHMSKPKYIREDDTVVEEFRQWQSDTRDKKALRDAVSGAVWSLIVALYFIISFTTQAWYITWVIFIIGGAVQSLLNVGFMMKK
ncbi:permease prefix domain 1-containing protein [Oscillospiraceae bacterium WX1]